jgi:hypothetical protein
MTHFVLRQLRNSTCSKCSKSITGGKTRPRPSHEDSEWTDEEPSEGQKVKQQRKTKKKVC